MEHESWVIYAYFNLFLQVDLFLLSLLLGPRSLHLLLKFNFFLHALKIFNFFLHDLKISDGMAEESQCFLGYSSENGVVSNLVHLIEMATVQRSSIPTLEFQLFVTLFLSGKLQIYFL